MHMYNIRYYFVKYMIKSGLTKIGEQRELKY